MIYMAFIIFLWEMALNICENGIETTSAAAVNKAQWLVLMKPVTYILLLFLLNGGKKRRREGLTRGHTTRVVVVGLASVAGSRK